MIVVNILDPDTGRESSRPLFEAGLLGPVQSWNLRKQSTALELNLPLPWRRSRDGDLIEPAEPVVEDLDSEVDKKVIDFLKSEIQVQTTTVKVELTVEVLPLG